MESLRDQTDEFLLRLNWKILEEIAKEPSIDATVNLSKKVLMRNIQKSMNWVTDEALPSSIAKMMQIPPLEGEEHVQHKIKEEESDHSKDDERSKYQLDAGNQLAAWYG